MSYILNLPIAINSIYQLINKKTNESEILEPLSTIIKLGIISYMDDDTKIGIKNNKIKIYPAHILQGVNRLVMGNSREEISSLLKPILNCIQLFPMYSNNENCKEKIEEVVDEETDLEIDKEIVQSKNISKQNLQFKLIYERSILGLKKLKITYNKCNNVSICIDLLILVLNDFIKNENKIKLDNTNITSNNIHLSHNSKINLYKIFNNIWTSDDITNIYNCFIELEKDSFYKKEYIKSIEAIISSKDGEIKSKISEIKNLI